ncbi:Holliday junction resolvase RecU [Eubacteriaceae bacterium ES2]|nr:Holliday junction resolvase RecU [Eubacteriaceae bacterium ES2]
MTKTMHNEENFVEHYPDPTAAEAIHNIEHDKKKENSRRGYRNRAAGQNFERAIMSACLRYKNIGIANIEKTPEPMSVTKPLLKNGPNNTKKRTGKFEAYFTKKAQPDFKGCMSTGKAVIFEAKTTDKDRINKDAVKECQFESLDSFWQMGAEVFVLLRFGVENYYRIPWGVWREMEVFYGRKYLKETDIQDCRIEFKNGYLDFLKIGNKK